MKQKVLFICTENRARSQMAEAMLRTWGGESFDAHSAGTDAGPAVNPMAIAPMNEIGIDRLRQPPKPAGPMLGQHLLPIMCVD